MDDALLSTMYQSGRSWPVSDNALEPHGICGSNFAYIFILTLSRHRDDASPSNISAGRDLLMKMLITLEPHGIF